MKRRWFALLLAAAVLCAAGIPASAAEMVEPPTQPLSARADAPVGEFATVLEMQMKSGAYSSMLVKTESYDKLLLHFSEQTVLLDTQTGLPAAELDMQKGNKVYI
ncbi:MAG: hypothetical protein ACOYIE_03165, partial [Agathobaculum sp.]|uniref:hypothetical protein n=1 Tax=Agathobaculum sp. TaxID=2048138 RepID=UPI003D947D19